jgi:hypothetical protein
VLFSLHVFEYFGGVLLLLMTSFISLWSDMMQGVILIFMNLLSLLCFLKYDAFWRKFHELEKRMCIAWLLGRILYRYQPCLFGQMYGVALKFLC